MLGTLMVRSGDLTIARFRTRRVASLLAYLALYADRAHPRSEIGELFWPEQDSKTILHNLRQALFSLKRQIEPPPTPSGSVLRITPAEIALQEGAFSSDVGEFEHFLKEARQAGDRAEQVRLLRQAIDLYRGEFLPGYYDEWVMRERRRLDDLFVFSLRQLVEAMQEEGRPDELVPYLRIAIEKEPYNESLHQALMRAYLEADRPASVIEQYRSLKRLLADHLGEDPAEESKRINRTARARLGPKSKTPTSALALADEGPDLAPEDAPASRLPTQLMRVFGRQAELATLEEVLTSGRSRLVTIVGPAGAGKTTLSIELGRQLSETHRWSVYFVSLVDLNSSMILDEIADVVGLQGSGGDRIQHLRNALGSSQSLLILDNLEHILDDAIPVLNELLDGLPDVYILLTSRHLTNIPGECNLEVSPLPSPGSSPEAFPEPVRIEDLLAYPSVQLFVDRCQLVRPDFQLTSHNAPAVAEICAKLEGLPLAIEIAASLSSVFAPAQMLKQLEESFVNVASRRRNVASRHRSLRAAIEYGVQSMPEHLCRLFFALSVFRGGFTVEDCAEVVLPWLDHSLGGIGPRDAALEWILELKDRSLVHSAGAREVDEVRFKLLEAFREYAEQQLSPDERADLRERHAQYFLRWFDAGEEAVVRFGFTAGQHPRNHLANMRAALKHFQGKNDYVSCVRLLAACVGFLYETSWTPERSYVRRLTESEEAGRLPETIRMMLFAIAGVTFMLESSYREAQQVTLRALEIAERLGDENAIARCCCTMARTVGYGEIGDAAPWWYRAAEHASVSQNRPILEAAYIGIGVQKWRVGDLHAAEGAFLKAQQVSRSWREHTYWLIPYNLGRVCLDQGRMDEGMAYIGDTLRAARALGDPFGIALSYYLVSRYHWLKGNLAAALEANHNYLLFIRRTAFHFWIVNAIGFQAVLLSEEGSIAEAVVLFAHFSRQGPNEDLHFVEIAGVFESLKATVDWTALDKAWARGLSMDVSEAIDFALRTHVDG